jgi:hypothetical protein
VTRERREKEREGERRRGKGCHRTSRRRRVATSKHSFSVTTSLYNIYNINIPFKIILAKEKPRDKRRRRGACYNIYLALRYTSFLLYIKP